MKYVYLGDKMTDPSLVGARCDPVLRPDGKCILGRGTQLVVFSDGVQRNVLRRRLRVRKVWKPTARELADVREIVRGV